MSAGNTNLASSHKQGTIAVGKGACLQLNYQGSAVNNDQMEVWYDGHDRFSATLTIPTQPETTIGPIEPGSKPMLATLSNYYDTDP